LIFIGQIKLKVFLIREVSFVKFSFTSLSLSYNCISPYDISCQLGKDFIFLSIIIQPAKVENVTISINADNTQNLIFFFLNSFGVKKNLNKQTIKTIVSANTSIENTIVVSFAIKAFMSFKLIQSPAKNLTSSTV
jgi:hypothetical protein